MSRSGYEHCDSGEAFGWAANVRRCIAGKRGQAFMWELYLALEAMPKRELITGSLVTTDGQCCALGAVAVARKAEIPDWMRDTDGADEYEFMDAMGPMFGIKDMLAREIMYYNDEADPLRYEDTGERCAGYRVDPNRKIRRIDTPAERWQRMRAWVVGRLRGIP